MPRRVMLAPGCWNGCVIGARFAASDRSRRTGAGVLPVKPPARPTPGPRAGEPPCARADSGRDGEPGAKPPVMVPPSDLVGLGCALAGRSDRDGRSPRARRFRGDGRYVTRPGEANVPVACSCGTPRIVALADVARGGDGGMMPLASLAALLALLLALPLRAVPCRHVPPPWPPPWLPPAPPAGADTRPPPCRSEAALLALPRRRPPPDAALDALPRRDVAAVADGGRGAAPTIAGLGLKRMVAACTTFDAGRSAAGASRSECVSSPDGGFLSPPPLAAANAGRSRLELTSTCSNWFMSDFMCATQFCSTLTVEGYLGCTLKAAPRRLLYSMIWTPHASRLSASTSVRGTAARTLSMSICHLLWFGTTNSRGRPFMAKWCRCTDSMRTRVSYDLPENTRTTCLLTPSRGSYLCVASFTSRRRRPRFASGIHTRRLASYRKPSPLAWSRYTGDGLTMCAGLVGSA
mmetsp:Transcript_20690/g.73075  ORF Transcript_20690/g.73075 Transcript_20690/m.73075 type:complete len:464 (+) Transcript_20690:174-1565(+)